MKRPNILFMHVDQMHWEAMSGYGNPHVKTPAMDRIAEDGCSFRASYATMPVYQRGRAGTRGVCHVKRVSRPTLIHRWALLPLLASGSIKKAPLVFDMLDDSALRPNQTLRYEGEIEIPVKGGMVKLDSYAQTGDGILPIHYLVDGKGQVQLITMATINWVLTGRQDKELE